MAMQVLQGKVLPEVLTKFKEAQENSGSETYNQFVEELLEAFLNPKTKTVEVPRPTADQLQEIQLKDNEIGRLKTAYSLLEEKYNDLDILARNLENNIKILQEKESTPGLSADQVILTIPRIIHSALNVEIETAYKKSGKVFTKGDILLNNFWESIKNGASHPFKIWSSSELTKLANDLKAAE